MRIFKCILLIFYYIPLQCDEIILINWQEIQENLPLNVLSCGESCKK